MYYYDRCMPMGCSSSCKTFETFSSALEWIAQNKLHIRHILHLLDDFLIIAPSYQLCQAQLSLFVDLCSYLGVPIAPEKTRGPSTTLCFAGVELDSVLFEARLPVEKITKCLSSISNFLQRKKVTLKEIQSLTGLLNFACTVVVPGRAFLRRLIDLTEGVRSPYHVIRMTREVKADLAVWQSFLTGFNGKSFFLQDTWYSSEKLNLFTDASGSLGFGAVFGSKWCYGPWPASWINRNIALLEFYPIVLSLSLWGSEMQNRCILFFTDNEALVHVINKQSCKDKELMFFVRKLVLVCLQNNIVIFVVQYSSYLNFCTSGVINLGLFSLCGMVALCQDLFFQRNFPFVLNIVDLIHHGTRVTVFELGLLLMLQRGECPTRRSEP